MIYLSGAIRPGMPAMVTPRMRQLPDPGVPWAADNGCYSRPQDYRDDVYLAWLERMAPFRADCLFATAPDRRGDAVATLELSVPVLPLIRALGYPAAFVGQDGAEYAGMVPWSLIDVLFVGGTDAWRHSDALVQLTAEARRRGKRVHVGRVNTRARLQYAVSLGADTADGTVLRFDPSRPMARWADEAARASSLWRPL